MMELFQKTFHTLAIIGNGFDLSHGFKTDYKSFVERSNHPCLEKFKEFCAVDEITTWYSFEENIGILLRKLFQDGFASNSHEETRKKTAELNEIFKEIQYALIEYLENETALSVLIKKPSIQKHLNDDTIAINFNYTDTAEAYTKNIVYVHGSFKERNIVLGCDGLMRNCLEQYDDIRWAKDLCRASLAFTRSLLMQGYDTNNDDYKQLMLGWEKYHQAANTGRGIDDEVRETIPRYNEINTFLKFHSDIPDIFYEQIKTIAIIGHGIEADRNYLHSLVGNCVNLEKVLIYRYDGESNENIKTKMSFFDTFCDNVELIDY